MSDIDLQGDEEDESTWWTPIGSSENNIMFEGTFEGNGFSITNMYTKISGNSETFGLFSLINNATIKNLTVGGYSNLGSNSGDYNPASGGIIGQALGNCQIINCINETKVEKLTTGRDCGGIIGVVGGFTADGSPLIGNTIITNCINKGEIIGGNNCGGLVGCVYGTLIINDSYNEGNVTNLVGTYVGGLIGRARGDGMIYSGMISINNSSNIGTITGKSYTAGIIARFDEDSTDSILSIDNCHNQGKIINEGKTATGYVGGILARTTANVKEVKITNSYNVTDIILEKESKAVVLGGIVGETDSTNASVINCYNSGNLEGDYTSGIVGLLSGTSGATPHLNILNTYNVGTITGRLYSSGIVRVHLSTATADIQNAYYLDTSATIGVDNYTTNGAIALEKNEMQLQDFVDELNNNQKEITSDKELKQWKYNEGDYPSFKSN